MRLTTLIMIISLVQVSAATLAQKVSLNKTNAPLKSVLKDIRTQSGYDFVVTESLLTESKPVSINVKDADLKDALDKIFNNQTLTYSINKNTITIAEKQPSFLDNIKTALTTIDVHGRVVDEKDQPLPGVTVRVKEGKQATITDAKGDFVIKGISENALIVFSFIGYEDKQVSANGDMGSIKLEVATSKLDEVQIQAYGQTSQRLSTGNISTIKAIDIERSPVGNPLLAIEGRVPGVFIQQDAGVPGSGIKIIIQGQNSIGNGNDPFYVIDGVPYTSQLLPGIGDAILGLSGSGVPNLAGTSTGGNPLNFINPQDIQSIDILKDADATSIYGSRASHGAIIITTKKGKAGKTAVNFNIQQGGGKIAEETKLLNTQQYLKLRKEAFSNDGIVLDPNDPGTVQNNPDLLYWDQNSYTDWQKKLIGNISNYTNVNSTITGGSSNVQYLISAGYQQDGSITYTDLKDRKASLHFNLSGSSENQKFKFNFSGSYVADDNKLAAVQNLATAAFTLPPNAPALYNPDGSINFSPLPDGTPSFNNPLYSLNNIYNNNTTNLISNMLLSYKLFPGLELKSSFGYNKLQSEEVGAALSTSVPPIYRGTFIRTSDFNSAKIAGWIIEPQLTYNKQLGDAKFDFLLGSTLEQEDRDRQNLIASGFSSDEAMLNIKAASSVVVDNANNAVILSTYKYAALFSRLNFNYKEKYLISASVRRDGSSRFGSNNEFHTFGSLGAGWIFSNESFLKNNVNILSFGKIKASYGTTGSDQIGDYSFLNLYGNTQIQGGTPYQGIIGLQPSSGFPNPYLEWELTKKFSTSLDLGFFADRILLNLTLYKNSSSNQLANLALPSITGGTGVYQNRPILIQNSGLELSITSINLKSEDFKWTTSVNLTVPRNKLIKYDDLDAELKQDLIGRPLGVFKVYHLLGVDPTTGIYSFEGHDGKPTSNPDPDLDKIDFVDLTPKLFGGFQNNFTYKNWSLATLFQFVKQNGANNIFGLYPGGFAYNQPVSVVNRWEKPGDVEPIQRSNTDFSNFFSWYNATQSNKGYGDASYIRLKNISLSYQLPKKWTTKLCIDNARLYVQGQNLLTITKYVGGDPESLTSYGIPPLKVLTLGLQVGL